LKGLNYLIPNEMKSEVVVQVLPTTVTTRPNEILRAKMAPLSAREFKQMRPFSNSKS
jgi:hypothetical protein